MKYEYKIKMIFKGEVEADNKENAIEKLEMMNNMDDLNFYDTEYNLEETK